MIITERQLRRIVSRIIEEKMREEMSEIDEIEEAEIREYDDEDDKKRDPLGKKNLTKPLSMKSWFGGYSSSDAAADLNRL